MAIDGTGGDFIGLVRYLRGVVTVVFLTFGGNLQRADHSLLGYLEAWAESVADNSKKKATGIFSISDAEEHMGRILVSRGSQHKQGHSGTCQICYYQSTADNCGLAVS